VTAGDPVTGVARQLAAYNARDLEGFAATYTDDVTIHRMPAQPDAIRGKEQLRAVYEVAGGLIRAVWFFYPAEPFPSGSASG
jgi:hypothetical protein